MGTYYRWDQKDMYYGENRYIVSSGTKNVGAFLFSYDKPSIDQSTGYYTGFGHTNNGVDDWRSMGAYVGNNKNQSTIVYTSEDGYYINVRTDETIDVSGGNLIAYMITKKIGNLISYVYSSSSTTYPNGGQQGDYWYDKLHVERSVLHGCLL